MRVADYIAQYLEQAGVQAAFMVSGGMMMHLIDAVGRVPGIRYYCNHHEQACAMAADAYARVSGRLTAVYATSGPGATNILTGLVGAWQDSSPVIFLTGQTKRKETIRCSGIPGLRQMGFLEVDIVPIVQSVTKYSVFVDDPESIRYHLEKAVCLATTGRPGPVLLDIPLDVQGAPVDPLNLRPYDGIGEDRPPVEPEKIRLLIARIASAKRPLLLAGHGIRAAGQVESFRTMVDRLGIPVLTSQFGKDLLAYEHPLFIGHPGVKGDRAGNFAIQTTDLIVSLGCSLHSQTTGYELDLFAPHAVKIQIERDEAILQRENVGVSEKLRWDLVDFIPALNAAISKGPALTGPWLDLCRNWKHRYPVQDEPHRRGGKNERVNLYDVAEVLSRILPPDAILMTDAGQPYYVLGQGFRVRENQRLLIPASFAEMGWCLPAAIGAAAARPGVPIVIISGDGSLQTNIQELQTIAHHGFNIKIVVISNDGYASIRNTQNAFFDGFHVGSTFDSGVSLPELSKIAKAYGLPYSRCDDTCALRRSIEEVLSISGPAVLEILGQLDQKILPGVPSFKLPDGGMRSKALHELAPEVNDEALQALLK